MTLSARAIAFALAAGGAVFGGATMRALSATAGPAVVARAVLLASTVAAICWIVARWRTAATTAAVAAAIDRLNRGARGDLDSAVPAGIAAAVPKLGAAMTDLFTQLNIGMSSIEHMALYDTITGLPNRNHFRSRCDAMLAEMDGQGRAGLLFIDLDRFKTVNDTLGHASGDVILGQVAQRLRDVVRCMAPVAGKDPLVGRLAGDEFTVFLPWIEHADEATQIARAIQAALSEPFDVHDHQVGIGASIGIALRPEHGTTLTGLMKAADTAMYHAKEGGRGRVEQFGPMLAVRLTERAALDEQLRQAVANDEFRLMFEPQVATADGRIAAVAALLRWQHPTEGIKLPESFSKRAEENGLIVDIGDWMIDAVAATIARWDAVGVAQRLSIKLSQRQIDQAGCFRRLHAAMTAARAPMRLLELELTETLAMTCSDAVLAAVADLRAAGATVTIGDFGSGCSSIARLRALPVDRIKLDRSIVADIVTDRDARQIAQSLIGLFHGLGCKAVGAGVESMSQGDLLRVLGCDAILGSAVAPPMDESACLRWIESDQRATRSITAA